ncbi:MAG: class I tRNA ligase family protein, partial [Pseudomonadota bacterium]
HIECSAMADELLWEGVKGRLSPEALEAPHTFDIHGGGIDLQFPHHENEIAQSCCANGTDRMANIWMHNGFLQVEGKKMSKSLGNFFTIHQLMHTEDFGGRKWPPEVLRLAMLMTHYREPIDFSVRRLEEAETLIRKHHRRVEEADVGSVDAVVEALSDDLSCTAVLKTLSELSGTPLAEALGLLGLEPKDAGEVGDDVQAAIKARLSAIADKNWTEADRIRDDLLAQGVQLKDGKDPETGERVTTWEVVR